MTEEKKSEPMYLTTLENICSGCDMCKDHGRSDCCIMQKIRASGPVERPFFPHKLVGEEEVRTTIPDFSKAKVGDWYQSVGDISTIYEENFVRRFGQLLIGPMAEQAPVTGHLLEDEVYEEGYQRGYVDGEKTGIEKGAKEERERVINEVENKITALKDRFAKEEMADGISLTISKKMGAARLGAEAAIKLVNSLRSNQKQEREPE